MSNKLTAMAVLSLSVVSVLPAYAAPKTISNLSDFQQWAEARMLCRQPAFADQENEKGLAGKLKKMGLKANIELDDSGIYSGSIEPGKTPVKLFGLTLRRIELEGDSGTAFDVQLAASQAEVSQLVSQQKLDHFKPVKYSGSEFYAVSKPSKQHPYGPQQRGVLVKQDGKGQVTVGCRDLDF